jgi:hypothetical protein
MITLENTVEKGKCRGLGSRRTKHPYLFRQSGRIQQDVLDLVDLVRPSGQQARGQSAMRIAMLIMSLTIIQVMSVYSSSRRGVAVPSDTGIYPTMPFSTPC